MAAKTRLPVVVAFAVLLSSVAVVTVGAQPKSRIPQRIEGYRGYTFGMTLAEARRVDPNMALTKCDYIGVELCLERDGEFFGESARLVVQFTGGQVSQVLISFTRHRDPQDQACQRVAGVVLKALLDRFGEPSRSAKKNGPSWYATRGGSIHLTVLCVDGSVGRVVVSYRPSPGF